jgi:arginyl-tRNA--protein-N-Asp/Glu arginylyltransferase
MKEFILRRPAQCRSTRFATHRASSRYICQCIDLQTRRALPIVSRVPAFTFCENGSQLFLSFSTFFTSASSKLQLKTVPAAYDPEAYALYVKYQTRVHKDAPSKLTPDGYANFLCNSPIARSDTSGVARARGSGSGSDNGVCGSFHQHYRVDGRLIAVGVVDMCVCW